MRFARTGVNMRIHRVAIAQGIGMVLVVAVSGCGPATQRTEVHTTSNRAPTTRAPGGVVRSMTRVHTYRSLAELWGDSTKLVEADVVSVEDVPAGPDDMLEAKVTVRVHRLLASKPDRGTLVREEGTVVVRQIGHVGVRSRAVSTS
jgi:hypothetical protein